MNWKLKQRIIEEYGSQVDFAQTIKVNETLVSKIVRGRRTLVPEKQLIWAKALGCKTKDIFADEG
jgi:plasmid maintenance system antidote protein VapI